MGCTAISCHDDNPYKCKGTIKGPDDSPYAGGVFSLDIELHNNYPFRPPKVSFTTKVYHCNIGLDGTMCLDILDDEWVPNRTIRMYL